MSDTPASKDPLEGMDVDAGLAAAFDGAGDAPTPEESVLAQLSVDPSSVQVVGGLPMETFGHGLHNADICLMGNYH